MIFGMDMAKLTGKWFYDLITLSIFDLFLLFFYRFFPVVISLHE